MKKIILLFLFGIVLCGCNPPVQETKGSFDAWESSELETTVTIAVETSEEPETAGMIFVHVCGAVVNPGVYELPSGSRAYEAVQMAGGVTEEAAGYMINLAEPLKDGERLYIPAEGESISLIDSLYSDDGDSVTSGKTKVNINTAPKEDLMLLTGIGSTKAQAIIDYREKDGPFSSIEDIMKVNGIKESAFEKIKDSITV